MMQRPVQFRDSTIWRFPRWSRVLSIAMVGAGLLVAALPGAAGEKPRQFSHGILIRFEGPIVPGLEQFLYRKLDVAKSAGADLVIIEIESPGGLVEESIRIAERLRDLQWAHTVAFVPREAISGAAMTALACDEIIMAPMAKLGDVGVIVFDQQNLIIDHAPEKHRSMVARVMRDLAVAKGRPPALAEAMVDMDLVVYRVKDTKTEKITFMSDAEIESSDDPDRWEKIKPEIESRKDHFLTVNGARAVELHLAEGNATTRDQLKERYDLTGTLRVLKPTAVDTAVTILNHPLVTGLLIVIGLIALYVEFSAPGIGIGGLTAGLCFAIFFWSRFLGGTAGWLEITLFVMGLVFLGVELFVLPGFGVAGLTGVLLLLVSLIMAGQNFFVPESSPQWTVLMTNLLVVAGSGAVVILATVALSSYFGTIPLVNRLALKPPPPDPHSIDEMADLAPVSTAFSEAGHASGFQIPLQVGDTGTADSPLRPAGKVLFGDEPVDVVTEGSFIEKGVQVRILKISGNRTVVREIDPSPGETG